MLQWKSQVLYYRSLEWKNKFVFFWEDHYIILHLLEGFPDSSVCEESACNMGDNGSILLGWEDLLEKAIMLFFIY